MFIWLIASKLIPYIEDLGVQQCFEVVYHELTMLTIHNCILFPDTLLPLSFKFIVRRMYRLQHCFIHYVPFTAYLLLYYTYCGIVLISQQYTGI